MASRRDSSDNDDEYGQRHGQKKPVIKKALVKLNGRPFKTFSEHRNTWAIETEYRIPGAIQYFGPEEACNRPTKTLLLEKNGSVE